MSAIHVRIEMKSRQRRNLRERMAEELRARNFERYARLEKKHAKLSGQIIELQAKAARAA